MEALEGGAEMDAATFTVTLDETADLQEQVRVMNLADGRHTIATYQGISITARIEGGKVVEYIAGLGRTNQPAPAHTDN
jgi:hypothetical protein